MPRLEWVDDNADFSAPLQYKRNADGSYALIDDVETLDELRESELKYAAYR